MAWIAAQHFEMRRHRLRPPVILGFAPTWQARRPAVLTAPFNRRRETQGRRRSRPGDAFLYHGPVPPRGDNTLTRSTLETLIGAGLGVCTLTKGGTRALRDIELFRSKRDAFASTLTSLDDRFSKKWERNAAVPADRIAALRAFHERRIFTWVSLEPTLDIEATLAIVRETHEYVDSYKVGRVNYLPTTRTTDWRDYTDRMLCLLNQVGACHYFKKDLQPYLPVGYFNPAARAAAPLANQGSQAWVTTKID